MWILSPVIPKSTRIIRRAVRTDSWEQFNLTGYTDPSLLDSWVLNELQDLFRRAQSDRGLNARLRGDKIIFFLHLVGLDINGHTFRPHSSVSYTLFNV